MPGPHSSGSFGDLLDPRFQKIFYEQYNELPDMLGKLYSMQGTNGRNNMMWSSVGALTDWPQFAGTVVYQSMNQGYDTTLTPLEFASGVQVERKLFDDDQYNIMDQRPKALATAVKRLRQKHGARIFNNANSVDSYFYTNTESVALVSDSHTTTAPDVSTSTGFDNLTTAALSATAVAAARIQMRNFRDDQGNRISVMPDELWFPPDLFEIAEEINGSSGKVDTDLNNINVHRGKYKLNDWEYLTDSNNWFMCDASMRKQSLFWTDRVEVEFAFAEDLDTLVAKWRGYGRWGMAHIDWRWVLGAIVS